MAQRETPLLQLDRKCYMIPTDSTAAVETILAQVRQILLAWDEGHVLGEVVIVAGHNDLQVVETPRRKLAPVKRWRKAK